MKGDIIQALIYGIIMAASAFSYIAVMVLTTLYFDKQWCSVIVSFIIILFSVTFAAMAITLIGKRF